MKKIFDFFIWTLIIFLISAQAAAQSVSLSKQVYAPSERITASYSGFPGNARDWVSVAQAGSADDKYIEWFYTEGKRTGVVSFNGLAYGNYELRGYYNNESIVRTRIAFKVGNADQNLAVKTTRPSYGKGEKIVVNYYGLPGNSRDWISIAQPGSADDKYIVWYYTEGKQSGTMEFAGMPEGNYEIRTYFNNEGVVRSRYPFTVTKNGTKGTDPSVKVGKPGRFCSRELSIFYSGMNSLGLAWGRLGSDVIVPATISDVQGALANAIAGVNAITCLDFDENRIRNFSGRLPGLSRVQAVAEIDQLIKDIQLSIQRANLTCTNGASLGSLFLIGIHLGASQGIANSFICRAIPMDWQGNLRNHLSLVSSGISSYSACIPGVNPSVVGTVQAGAPNAYIPFSTIVGIHIQVLWSVSLSPCCCTCK